MLINWHNASDITSPSKTAAFFQSYGTVCKDLCVYQDHLNGHDHLKSIDKYNFYDCAICAMADLNLPNNGSANCAIIHF